MEVYEEGEGKERWGGRGRVQGGREKGRERARLREE